MFDASNGHLNLFPETKLNLSIFNSAALGPDGNIWGLATQGIFKTDLKSGQTILVQTLPSPITAGFAFDGHSLFFACGAKIYQFKIPI